MNYSLSDVERLKKFDSKLNQFFSDPERMTEYDDIIIDFAVRQAKKGKLDANSVLQTYEMAIDLDKRIVMQMVEQSWLRKSFKNFPGEKMFYEYTGVDPTAKTYEPILMAVSGLNNTTKNAQLKFAQNPNEMKIIQASTNVIRRPVKAEQEGFYLTLRDLEIAAARNIPLQQGLTSMVARDLAISEQSFAFYSDEGNADEEKGLFNNGAISTSITASVNWTTSTSGRAIVNDIIAIKGQIISATDSVFEEMPFCLLVSRYNLNILDKTYSDLDGQSILRYLTDRDIRVGGMRVMPDTHMFAYYNDPMNLELSTAQIIRALPQSYSGEKVAYFMPFENITAGLTVKRPESIYYVSGIGS